MMAEGQGGCHGWHSTRGEPARLEYKPWHPKVHAGTRLLGRCREFWRRVGDRAHTRSNSMRLGRKPTRPSSARSILIHH